MNYIRDGQCKLKGPDFCLACRTNKTWRESVRLPVECPEGVDLTNLPIESRPGKKGACLTCAERKAQAGTPVLRG